MAVKKNRYKICELKAFMETVAEINNKPLNYYL